jgi:hypothetical protein
MTTIMRDAFERLAAARPQHPWVAKRLRHLLDRSNAGTYKDAHYRPGRDQEWGALRKGGVKGSWGIR